ncbi:membrane-bound lytic murein transglycosylase B [Kribbella orskensis]|uniref:Membrane-bound lytic murein transglycosylase B n=1 Tax=Kribbella orskensis TaxID=2512216 RepID=A0ABY2B5P6_9ACTN|nr:MULTISPECIES: lytic transglycosylase domain-containing protein [Kribbella]TCN27537.1 membrane-bound lytic murein transglycosylase B [Kribbella sp. VKM Ac-2500]TCO07538.1 membrane-bound lytic murein transglycosylase B [Kribbella orskensis]
MRMPGLHKLIKRHGRRHPGRHRRGRPATRSRYQFAGAAAAVVTLGALASAPFPDRPATSGYDAAGAAAAPAADPFIEDEVLDEFVAPEQLDAVPVGPDRVAKPVQMVLSGAPVIRTLGESGIPAVALRAYKQAEARLAVSDPGCGVPWTVLAAIGRVESNHGRFGGAQLREDGSATRRIRGIPLDGRPNVALIRDSDGGALDGDTVYDRAVGPMQFIPSTWRAVNADGNGDGFGNPNNMFDAAQGAAQYLCTGTSNLRNPAQAAQAVRRYNNADSYVRVVLALARMYQTGRVVGLPSTGDQLPDEPTDPPAVRPWPTDPPPAVRPWTTNPPPDGTVLAKPAPAQRTEPATPPRAATRPQTTTPPPNRPNPASPRPAKPVAPEPSATTTSEPPAARPPQARPTTNPNPSETTPPSEPAPTEPKASQPKASEPKPSESDSPTPAPSAEPTRAQQPTTAAVGWAPAMRQVVGRALAKPACPPTPTPQPDQPSETCPHDPAEPSPARDGKNRERCTPQNVCKVPGPPRPSARSGR